MGARAKELIEAYIAEVSISAAEWKRLTYNNGGHLDTSNKFMAIFPSSRNSLDFDDELEK